MRFPTSQQPAPGLGFGHDEAFMIVGSGLASGNVGDGVVVDMSIVDTSLRWTTITVVAAGDITTASGAANAQRPMGVLIDPITASGQKVRVRFRGDTPLNVNNSAIVVGSKLMPIASVSTAAGLFALSTATTGTGNRAVAVATQANSSAAAQIGSIFNGIDGFGYSITNTT